MINIGSFSPSLIQHASKALPKLLYHYTSPEGLLGIVSNKELWATSTMFLNDSSEASHGIELAKRLLEERFREGKLPRNTYMFLDDFARFKWAPTRRTYVVSFTELGDSLSQWRAYCPASGGYAIGFPAAQVSDMANGQKFSLVKCLYDRQEQAQILNEFIDGFIKDYESRVSSGKEPTPLEIQREFDNQISQISLLMKHPSFEEEKEWRLVAFDVFSNPNMAFRPSSKGIIPFIKFKLTNAQFPNLVERDDALFVVCIGPTADHQEKATATGYMISHYLPGSGYSISGIPYKTW
jgi:hypothetical protein